MIYIVIPCYNCYKVSETINSILRQKGKYKIFLIDDGSEKKFIKKLKNKYKNNITIISKEHSGLGKTRNYALNYLKNKKFKYLLFLDSDIILDKNWFRNALANKEFKKKNSAAICGKVDWVRKTKWDLIFHSYEGPDNEMVLREDNFFILPFCYLIKKEWVYKTGYFDPFFTRNGEDMDWFLRMLKKGGVIIYDPRLKSVHLKSYQNFSAVLKDIFSTSQGELRHLKYLDKNLINHLLKVAITIMFFIGPLNPLLFAPLILLSASKIKPYKIIQKFVFELGRTYYTIKYLLSKLIHQ